MCELSLSVFQAEAQEEVLPATETSLNASSDGVMSPELMDALFWSVLVGFVVNVAAGLVTPLLQRKARSSLTAADIAEIKKVFATEVIRLKEVPSQQELRNAALSAIPESLHTGTEELANSVVDAALKAIRGR